jgi:Fe-S cluster assembly iron-binding protein IscA
MDIRTIILFFGACLLLLAVLFYWRVNSIDWFPNPSKSITKLIENEIVSVRAYTKNSGAIGLGEEVEFLEYKKSNDSEWKDVFVSQFIESFELRLDTLQIVISKKSYEVLDSNEIVIKVLLLPPR